MYSIYTLFSFIFIFSISVKASQILITCLVRFAFVDINMIYMMKFDEKIY